MPKCHMKSICNNLNRKNKNIFCVTVEHIYRRLVDRLPLLPRTAHSFMCFDSLLRCRPSIFIVMLAVIINSYISSARCFWPIFFIARVCVLLRLPNGRCEWLELYNRIIVCNTDKYACVSKSDLRSTNDGCLGFTFITMFLYLSIYRCDISSVSSTMFCQSIDCGHRIDVRRHEMRTVHIHQTLHTLVSFSSMEKEII